MGEFLLAALPYFLVGLALLGLALVGAVILAFVVVAASGDELEGMTHSRGGDFEDD